MTRSDAGYREDRMRPLADCNHALPSFPRPRTAGKASEFTNQKRKALVKAMDRLEGSGRVLWAAGPRGGIGDSPRAPAYASPTGLWPALVLLDRRVREGTLPSPLVTPAHGDVQLRPSPPAVGGGGHSTCLTHVGREGPARASDPTAPFPRSLPAVARRLSGHADGFSRAYVCVRRPPRAVRSRRLPVVKRRLHAR